ncbi:hypothetical protein Acsp06_49930 [Actinomycetospora sp. NBRC 106375]|uniref:hypothetical protein n=1 Tax=Actinomycetospora sp. NBRC 106375 TaxID=3032207 RepID=UPI0024A4B4D6|nr:hypothetical protein [Actinomycetospora sp. NBRC 106375]GLZ48808.1 hypothetical protein Acsp06_49930 [Actinomycetospora sp. NBRC 106375]
MEQFLASLASGDPESDPRAGAALHVALGAALVARVARAGAGDRATEADAVRVEALAGASPGRVIELADRTLRLAEAVRPAAPRAAVPRIAAAAEALRAAVGTARVDVEADLVTDPAVRAELLAAIEPVDDLVLRAAKLTAVVREQSLRM